MSDAYLAISEIANDENMTQRVTACTTQQWHLGSIDLGPDGNNAYNVGQWVISNRYVWAASPDWGAAWDSALAAQPDDPAYEPGADPAVITDGQILATVQVLAT
jgi:hypothetical protein